MRLVSILLLANVASGACLPITEAPKRIGDTVCITGKVVQVAQSKSGNHFLNFCADYSQCPFSVVVFRKDLPHVGDVRSLEGKTIEIHGPLKLYQGRPEMVLSNARQLRGEAAKLPPAPKTYDVERKGKYSAGKFTKPGSKHQPSRRDASPPSTQPSEPTTPDDRD